MKVNLTPFASVLLALLSFGLHTTIASDKTRLVVQFSGLGDFSCDSSYRTVLYADGMYDIKVVVLPEGKLFGQVEYAGITDWSWPKGLTILVGPYDEPFQPSAALKKQLHLEYYITTTQTRFDSTWRATGNTPPAVLSAPEYHFAFLAPSSMSGSFMCVRIKWNHPQYGRLTNENLVCAKIIEPCSEKAQHAAWTTHVCSANSQKKYDLTIALADSFISRGWHDLYGLFWARFATQNSGRYKDAIRLLDLCFQMNHTIMLAEGEQEIAEPTDAGRRMYEMQRTKLVEACDQQQKQR
jgi:hypothetical protein